MKEELKLELPLKQDTGNGSVIWTADNQRFCDMRGWGYLTGTGGLHLSSNEAAKIQDARGKLVVDAVNRFVREEEQPLWVELVPKQAPIDESHKYIKQPVKYDAETRMIHDADGHLVCHFMWNTHRPNWEHVNEVGSSIERLINSHLERASVMDQFRADFKNKFFAEENICDCGHTATLHDFGSANSISQIASPCSRCECSDFWWDRRGQRNESEN